MKALIDGVWRTDAEPTDAFRQAAERARVRDRVSADGSTGLPAAAGRYHLHVSYACPFAHRTLLARALLGLEAAVPFSVLDPDWSGPQGRVFNDGPLATPDRVNGLGSLPEVYLWTERLKTSSGTSQLLNANTSMLCRA